MLHQTSESPHKQTSKRFALKKEIPILKQFRKIYKQYNQKPHPHLIQKETTKQQIKLAELEVERLSNSLTLNFDIFSNRKIQNDQNKSSNDDSEYSPFSQNTFSEETILKEQHQKELDFNMLYQIYLEKQFTEDKKQRCLEWLSKI
ncbi:unnamed protein product (macronuclear) [Paramecium tetraurelia]|uniref:DUF4485 domain-containing protein n=1 Tax=Paramecium tetraurelia TaxID=5888 RepID=A0CDX3_PARTE|nr:uncharacterized protein GSPATT00007202001 [Paramecium tetraurelia]CAK68990.1 unnamed protein product [Paramecium tetraurelia]|eukprot:XP_001436387.1 hypothetical protein (macronuclear) [Paramecium tetraurelia strain d4-2]